MRLNIRGRHIARGHQAGRFLALCGPYPLLRGGFHYTAHARAWRVIAQGSVVREVLQSLRH